MSEGKSLMVQTTTEQSFKVLQHKSTIAHIYTIHILLKPLTFPFARHDSKLWNSKMIITQMTSPTITCIHYNIGVTNQGTEMQYIKNW